MTSPGVYLLLPGTAREALEFYRTVFGGDLHFSSYADFTRTDGPADAIAHGELRGTVSVSAADAGADEDALAMVGMKLSLLGVAGSAVLRDWFDGLSEGGRVVAPLERRPWGDTDGLVVDRFGVRWLIGWLGGEGDERA